MLKFVYKKTVPLKARNAIRRKVINPRLKKLKKIAKKTYRYYVPFSATDKKMIVFDSSTGVNYTGSPRAIYERMVELGLDKEYRCVWFFKKRKAPREGLPGSAEIVRYGSFKYLKYMMKAGIWIFDARQAQFLRKKKDQHYIQTWHGTPLKRLALDMDSVSMAGSSDIETYKKNFLINTSIWDYLIAQNEFSAEIFTRCFDFHKTMLKIGYPRNDILFKKNNPEDIRSIKERLGLPLDKKILLYAPTWRDNEYDERGVYEFKPKLDFTLLREKLPSDYILIVKYHYLIGDKIDWSGFEGFVYPFNAKAEINLLYLVADELITDYSSVMFDYALLHRPMYFYAYDLESYKNELRGFYFDFMKEIPGPISQTTEELISDILKPQEEKDKEYEEKRQAFYERFHDYETGTASDQIIELIKELSK